MEKKSAFNKNQEKNESHQIKTYDEFICEDAIGRVVFNFIKPGEDRSQHPGKSAVVDDQSRQPDRLSPTRLSKLDYDRSWPSQEWKNEGTAHDRSGKPDKTSWSAMQQICPHHGDALLDGNAHSVRYGEMIHGSGQIDSANYQEEAENFRHGK